MAGRHAFGLIYLRFERHAASRDNTPPRHTPDSRDFTPIGFQPVNYNRGKEVDGRHIVKGHEYKKGEFVVVANTDFKHDSAGRPHIPGLLSIAIGPRPPWPCSHRARAGVTVSMPIPRKVARAGLDPAGYTVRTAPGILRRSGPWNEHVHAARPLPQAARMLTAS
jgi:hypothetical protein